jgi:hypothetical protein
LEEPRRHAAPGVGGADGKRGAAADGNVFGGAPSDGALGDDVPLPEAFEAMTAADLPAPRDPATDPDRRDVILGDAPASGAAFGDTPIGKPVRGFTFGQAELPRPPEPEPVQRTIDVDPATRVRQAAVSAAIRAGIQACVVGMFMGLLLGFFLAITGLLSGATALTLGTLIFLAAPPVALLAAWSVYRQATTAEREKTGLCPTCGYDLRGIVTERCPECGTPLGRQSDREEFPSEPPDPPAWSP